MSRSLEEWTYLFEKVGVKRPEEWAESELAGDLGNLAAAAFLRQAWNEIPASGDAAWLGDWMRAAKGFESAKGMVAACDRITAAGALPGDLVTVIRGALGQFLYRLCYLLDDNSIEDEELKEEVRWGLFELDEDDEPSRPMGCVHELVFRVDPENDEG